MLRSLQCHAQLIANSILLHAEYLSKERFCNRNLWKAGLADVLTKVEEGEGRPQDADLHKVWSFGGTRWSY